MTMDCGPYDNLKPNFRENWREVPSTRPKLFGKKGVRYWEGNVQLFLHFTSGESVYGSTNIEGAKLLNPETFAFEKRSRRRLKWFKATGS